MPDGIVNIHFDFTANPGTQTDAVVSRGFSATGPWTVVANVVLLGEEGYYTDTTAPLNTPIWYFITATPEIVANEILIGPITEISNETLVLLKDPLRPWANLELSLCATMTQAMSEACGPISPEMVWVGLGTKTYRADANLFDVYNDTLPADIFGVRKRLDGEMRILTKTLAAKDAVETFFAGGGPVQIQLPTIYGFPDVIVQPGDVTEEYLSIDQRRPIRMWTAPFTAVRQPFGPSQGTECANWCAVKETFPTFNSLITTGYTWGQVASGIAVCPTGALDGYGNGPYGDGPYGDGG